MPRIRVGLMFALLAVSVSACGGSDEDSAKKKPTVTRAQYIAKADGVCQQFNDYASGQNKKMQAAVNGASSDQDALAKVAPVLRESLTHEREVISDFKQLDYPPADKAQIVKYHASLDSNVDLVEKITGAAEQGDVQSFSSLTDQQKQASERSDAIAQGYGFKVCGTEPS